MMDWNQLLAALCSIWHLVFIWTAILGIGLVFSALLILFKNNYYGVQHNQSFFWMFGTGVFFYTFPTMLDAFSTTLGFSVVDTPAFCMTSDELFSYYGNNGGVSEPVAIAYAFLTFIGIISVYKTGQTLVNRGKGVPGETMGKAMVYALAGVFLLNIQDTDKILGTLFGTSGGLIGSIGLL